MEKGKSIVQHNAITTARYDMTLMEKRIVYFMQKLIKADDETTTYNISVNELLEDSGSKDNYNHVRQATKKLIGRVYEIKEGKDLLQVSLISSAKYISRSGLIEISFDPKVKPYLLFLKDNFTKFDYGQAILLRSIYSQRMFEMLSSYHRNGTGWWLVTVDDLKYMLKVENKYPKLGLFREYVLETARKELTEKTDIHFTYELIKDNNSRKVSKIKFSFTPKLSIVPELVEADKNMSLLARLTDRFKLSAWQAAKVINGVPEPQIHKTLFAINGEVNNKKVNNVGGYTATIFRKQFNVEI